MFGRGGGRCVAATRRHRARRAAQPRAACTLRRGRGAADTHQWSRPAEAKAESGARASRPAPRPLGARRRRRAGRGATQAWVRRSCEAGGERQRCGSCMRACMPCDGALGQALARLAFVRHAGGGAEPEGVAVRAIPRNPRIRARRRASSLARRLERTASPSALCAAAFTRCASCSFSARRLGMISGLCSQPTLRPLRARHTSLRRPRVTASAPASASASATAADMDWPTLHQRASETPTGARLASELAQRALGKGPTHTDSLLRLFGNDKESDVRVTLYRDTAAWCPYCQKARSCECWCSACSPWLSHALHRCGSCLRRSRCPTKSAR